MGSAVLPLVNCRIAIASRRPWQTRTSGPRPGAGVRRTRSSTMSAGTKIGQLRVDEHDGGVCVGDASTRRLDELVDRTESHGQREHRERGPREPRGLDRSDECSGRRAEDRDGAPGSDVARLERGRERAGFVVEPCPLDHFAGVAGTIGRTGHEGDGAPPIGCGLEPQATSAGRQSGWRPRWRSSGLLRPPPGVGDVTSSIGFEGTVRSTSAARRSWPIERCAKNRQFGGVEVGARETEVGDEHRRPWNDPAEQPRSAVMLRRSSVCGPRRRVTPTPSNSRPCPRRPATT